MNSEELSEFRRRRQCWKTGFPRLKNRELYCVRRRADTFSAIAAIVLISEKLRTVWRNNCMTVDNKDTENEINLR